MKKIKISNSKTKPNKKLKAKSKKILKKKKKTKKIVLTSLKLSLEKLSILFVPFVKIRENKVLNDPTFSRIIIIAFFFGLNIILLPYFLRTNRVRLPKEITTYLVEAGIMEEESFEYFVDLLPPEQEPSLDPEILLEKLNIEREIVELKGLRLDSKLTLVAEELLKISKEYDYDISEVNLNKELKAALDNAEYDFSYVSHNMVVGPLLEQAVIDAWFSDDQQIAALQSDEFEDVGFATAIIEFEESGTLGVVVQVLGVARSKSPATIQNSVPATSPFVNVSDKEVFDALNLYRDSYDIHPLKINDNLCSYAQKRVGDLVVNGGLDNHAGFKKDFENPENIPESIKNFSGTQVGENLAFQHCKNMKTGESFYANTGIALIEWCFDSSTAGHREAQLNKDYQNVCVRHGENMYVIIFGE